MSYLLFKGYGAIKLRLPKDPGEAEREDACEQPGKHAADQKVRHHAGRSVARKAQQIAPQYHTAGDVNPMQRKHRLGPVDGNARNLGHGRSPVRVSTTELWHQMPRGRPPQRNSAAPSAFLPASGLDDPY
jgi:hypothetical protein